MLESTFQLGPGLGPVRERRLWDMGVRRWQDFPRAPGVAMSRRTDDGVRSAVAIAQSALAHRDSDRLAAMLPSRERWRMFAVFGDDAGYLDIETGGDERDFAGVTAVSLLDRHGPRLFLAGKNLADFPAVARGHSMLVTFNGLSFDVPILRRAFPLWKPPLCHVDLRHVWARLGHHGGLKSLERKMGLRRPDHLAHITGWDAVWLWRHAQRGDRRALRLFAEYNLYDTVNLRTLMGLGYNRLLEGVGGGLLDALPVQVSHRGDVLYDVSNILLSL